MAAGCTRLSFGCELHGKNGLPAAAAVTAGWTCLCVLFVLSSLPSRRIYIL